MNIFIVEGSTGEYSDHREWPVAAYFSEDKAKLHVVNATQRKDELWAKCDGNYWELSENDKNEYDPCMSLDYTNTRYRYYGVEVKDTP